MDQTPCSSSSTEQQQQNEALGVQKKKVIKEKFKFKNILSFWILKSFFLEFERGASILKSTFPPIHN